jgi:alcohol dehydrogenase class IV
MQQILSPQKNYAELDNYLINCGAKKVFLVCGNSIEGLQIGDYFLKLKMHLNIDICRFSNFQPNPLYESVLEGVEVFNSSNSDIIIAVGGGSAIDVAKAIKLYSDSHIDLVAIPTTAGTGSEATRYSVIYKDGEKQSLTDNRILPSAILFDPNTLNNLPRYHKKAALLDALCHCLESFWSVNSTVESQEYAKDSICIILKNYAAYLRGDNATNERMLRASYLAWKAINISQTTAGHAMCYKLTSFYNIAHGHAAALVVNELWPWMLNNMDKCVDYRGIDYLEKTFMELSDSITIEEFSSLLQSLHMPKPEKALMEDIEILKKSVNPDRLKNNPIGLDEAAITELYKRILFNL